VVVTGLNDQNVKGTLDVLELTGIEPRARDATAEPWDDADDPSDAEHRAKSLGPKPTLIVASPLPAGEISFKEQRLAEIEKRLGPVAARLSYHPKMALIESLFVRDHPMEYLAMEYDQLADRLMEQVGDHYAQLAQRAVEDWDSGDQAKAVHSAVRLAAHDANIGKTLLAQLANAFSPTSDAEFLAARKLYATLEPAMGSRGHEVLNNWGLALLAQAKTRSGEEADRLFALAGEKFAMALEIKPDMHDALSNWGLALAKRAKTRSGVEADQLFALAYDKYAKALDIKPDMHDALNNWGAALLEQAKTKSGVEADRLFALAYEKYAQALEIKPDDHEALYGWGGALLEQAKTRSDEEADRLWEEARERLLAANAIEKGSATFNLACLAALTGDVDECLARLQEAVDAGYPLSRLKVEEETDFAGVLDHPDMQRFLAELDSDQQPHANLD